MMEEVKGIPYGVSNFEQVISENKYYVDKTMYLPMMEETGNYLFLIRPRRFGKSVFISMMRAYYDMAKTDEFDTLFDGLWIQKNPTKWKNRFQIVYFDFSLANKGLGDLQHNFNDYLCGVLDTFINTYKTAYSEQTYQKILSADDAAIKLDAIHNEANAKGYPLYLIIDEYDNFTNVILSEGGKELFHNLTHASGFYREYFKTFKAMFNRVFLIGVSPITLDDLSSGYNIDWGISNDPRFNPMLGFSETEVREMFTYYQRMGKLEGDIDEMLKEMHPWYNNYCFARKCLKDPKMFNCDMTLYYLRSQVLYHCPPEEMADKNIRTDYKKLKMLADIDQGNKRESRMCVIEEIAVKGYIMMNLKTSFPAYDIADDDNFRSLIYYYGLLTIGGESLGRLKMVIPNKCVKEQYWGFMRTFYQKSSRLNLTDMTDNMEQMATDGEWKPLINQIAHAYKENSSVRDSILGEHNLQGFFKAYLSLNYLYLVEPETELNYGYCDFLLLPDKVRFPEVSHSYILEMKYAKTTATDAEVKALCDEADKQLQKYSNDKIVRQLSADTTMHLVKVIFRGAEMAVCEEL